MARSAGFVWNHPDNPYVLGIYLPESVSIYTPATELLALLGIDPELNQP